VKDIESNACNLGFWPHCSSVWHASYTACAKECCILPLATAHNASFVFKSENKRKSLTDTVSFYFPPQSLL